MIGGNTPITLFLNIYFKFFLLKCLRTHNTEFIMYGYTCINTELNTLPNSKRKVRFEKNVDVPDAYGMEGKNNV